MQLWFNVSSYNVSSYSGVSPQSGKNHRLSISCKLILFISFISLFFVLSPVVFCCFWNQSAQAQNFTAAIHSVHPNQLDNAGDYVIKVQGKNLDHISRIVLTQSLPYIKSTLLVEDGSIGEVTALDFQDPYVYAITDYSKISIIDISDPNRPQVKSVFDSFKDGQFIPLDVHLNDIHLVGDYLFITDIDNGLWVLNIRKDTAPPSLECRDRHPKDSAYEVYVEAETGSRGDEIYTIYLTSGEPDIFTSELQILRLTETGFGVISTTPEDLSIPRNLDVELHPFTKKQYIYVGNTDSVVVFKRERESVSQIGVPLNDTFFDPNHIYYPPLYFEILDVKVNNEYLYVLDKQYGLYVVDMTNPQVPKLSHRLPLAADRKSITIRNNLALVAGRYGLDLIDISLPSTPVFMHYIITDGWAHSTKVEMSKGKYVFIANGGGGFALADIQTLINPPSIGHLDMKGNIQNLTISENQAYVAMGEAGLRIVEIKDPWDPRLRCSLEKSDFKSEEYIFVSDCCLYENGLYLANDPTLCIFDNSPHLERPLFEKVIELPLEDPNYPDDKIESITINSNYLYILMQNWGLEISEIISPLEAPVLFGGFDTGSQSNQNIWVEDTVENTTMLYLADGTQIFYIVDVDVSDLLTPIEEISHKDVARSFIDIGVKGDYAYLINGIYSSVTVVETNIHEKKDPEIIDWIQISNDYLVACSIWDDFLYVAGSEYGIRIIDISEPFFPVILDNLAIPRGSSAVHAAQKEIYIGEQSDMFHVYSAPRNLQLLNHGGLDLDPLDPNRDPNAVLFRIPEGLPTGYYDLIFLSDEREKIRKYKALQIETYATINLKAGLTLFGYPGKIPYEYLESDDLIKVIDPNSTGIVLSLRQENPTKMSYWQSGELMGDHFNIADNRGYLLYLQEDTYCVDFRAAYYFPLEVVLYHLSQELEEGSVHWISFPVKDEEKVFSFDILGKLKKNSGLKSPLKMQKLNTLSGKWESAYNFFGRHSGQNFLIKKGEGYLLYNQD